MNEGSNDRYHHYILFVFTGEKRESYKENLFGLF